MKEPKHAREIIRAAKRGAAGRIPVSVKTRIGYNKDELASWLPELLAEEPAAITVHARTRKEMSLVPARWEHVSEAVRIRDSLQSKTLILGNGDVENLAQARERVAETHADGVMIGRGIFGNPWLFSEHEPTLAEKLSVLAEHTTLFEELCSHKSFAVMKKHFKAYVNGFDGAKQLRAELMECNDALCVTGILEKVLKEMQ
jgi:tRNA-dihydrouridine synthase